MAAAAALLAAAPVIAAGPALAAGPGGAPVNLSGFYSPAFPLSQEPDPVLAEMIPAGTVHVQDSGAVEFPSGEYGGLIPTPAALAAAEAWRPEDDMTISRACAAPGMYYTMQGPFPLKIYHGTEFIIIQLEYYDLTRIVFTDGRGHPDDMPATKMGHSIGWWEDDVLVVETTHLAEATITNNGLDHSEQARVIERFRLVNDGTRLTSTQEIEDPEALENRGYRAMHWSRAPEDSDHLYPYDCDPSFGANYGVFD